MVVNVHILYLFSHCVSFALLIIDFTVILHVRLIRVLLKINQSSHFSKGNAAMCHGANKIQKDWKLKL